MAFSLRSPAFAPHEPIPREHCFPEEGDNVPPPLEWEDPPEGTRSFALLVEDPDAPRATPWVHWVAHGIAADQRAIRPEEAQQLPTGPNDFGQEGWGGPLPPEGHGKHRYFFKLFALDREPELPEKPDKEALLAGIEGAVLAAAETVGTYER